MEITYQILPKIKLYYKNDLPRSNRCSCDISGSGKKEEKMGGLIYAATINPPDFIHLVHNGCDKGLEFFKISTRRQLLEDVGEVETWIAEEHLHQHLLQNSGTDCA